MPTLPAPAKRISQSLQVCTTNTISFSFSPAHTFVILSEPELSDSFPAIVIIDITAGRIGAGHRHKDQIDFIEELVMAGDQFKVSGVLAARLCG
jgi:hypothetical protein